MRCTYRLLQVEQDVAAVATAVKDLSALSASIKTQAVRAFVAAKQRGKQSATNRDGGVGGGSGAGSPRRLETGGNGNGGGDDDDAAAHHDDGRGGAAAIESANRRRLRRARAAVKTGEAAARVAHYLLHVDALEVWRRPAPSLSTNPLAFAGRDNTPSAATSSATHNPASGHRRRAWWARDYDLGYP